MPSSKFIFLKKFDANIRLRSRWLRMATALPIVVCTLSGVSSRADVFSYVDEEGVVCFTDSPKKKGAVRIYSDRKTVRHSASKGRSLLPRIRTEKASGMESTEAKNGFPSDMTLPVEGRISSIVGLRHDPFDGLLRFHNGIDIAVAEGTPVKPVAPGIVHFSGVRNGFGNMVIITHDDGMITIYAHHSLNLSKEGERVNRETTIALSGSTGRSTGPHLHFEAWKNGTNLTESFLGEISAGQTALAAVRPRRDIIRTSIQADGSLLFTNLP